MIFNELIWTTFNFIHTPNTPLKGFSSTNEVKDDWHVMNFEKGDLYMNNVDGYMYVIGNDGKTYAKFI